MDVYMVSYDLSFGEREDYAELYEAIENCGNATRVLKSAWMIAADGVTDAAICEHLEQHIDAEDKLFVAKIAADRGTPQYSNANLDADTLDRMHRSWSWWNMR